MEAAISVCSKPLVCSICVAKTGEEKFDWFVTCDYVDLARALLEGGPGVPVTPALCKPFFKQTTYSIPWRKHHDDIV